MRPTKTAKQCEGASCMRPSRTPEQREASYARLERGGIIRKGDVGSYANLPGLFKTPAALVAHMAAPAPAPAAAPAPASLLAPLGAAP